ncbi:NAD(P)-binding protein [Coprinellus micaceus]|uniref:NAD(P)-binding protein n=1 Tax=Coprinellus micaceus TaxID=71717 RepID=A0A4Y7TVQ1_COPMI|nr:NAD(P)-binding protein [Coprinellus micaceus]
MSKVVLITGANQGIGYELVKLLAANPEVQKVYLGARNPKSGQEALNAIKGEGFNNVQFIKIDVTDPTSITAAKSEIEANDGKLDVLVNNAGIGEFSSDQNALTVDVATVRRTVETNLFGLIQVCTTFVPLIRKSPQAAILNVTTDMASNHLQAGRPILHLVAYNTSKAAANSYTIALANELKKDGVKVNAVTPGFTSTNLNNHGVGGKTPKQGAETLVKWALLDKDGPTGQFFDEHGKEFPW